MATSPPGLGAALGFLGSLGSWAVTADGGIEPARKIPRSVSTVATLPTANQGVIRFDITRSFRSEEAQQGAASEWKSPYNIERERRGEHAKKNARVLEEP